MDTEYEKLKTVHERTKIELIEAQEKIGHLMAEIRSIEVKCEKIYHDYI